MCGIFGEIRRINSLNDRFDLKDTEEEYAMKSKHRGSPITRVITFQHHGYHLYFVFRRLSINGLDEKSNQPMRIRNTVLCCNGEIYNYKELAKEYQLDLMTNSDCEIIYAFI